MILAVIKEAFGVSYDRNITIQQFRNEHYIMNEEIVTDSFLMIGSDFYHIEWQTLKDKQMIIRMYQYSTMIATEKAIFTGKKFVVDYPKELLVYLNNVPDIENTIEMEVNFPDGQRVIFSLPVLKITVYELEEIFEKDLLMFVPYFPARYKNRNAGLNSDTEKQQAFLDKLRYLNKQLQKRLTTETTYSNIAAFIDLSNYVMEVIRHVVTNRNLVKEAENIMINSEVKSYSRKLTEEGIAQGRAEGEAQGRAEGEAQGRAEGEDFILKIIRQLSEKGLFDVIVKLSRKEISAMECAKKYNLML